MIYLWNLTWDLNKDQTLIKTFKSMEISSIKNLWISWLSGINDTEVSDLNEFLKNSSISKIDNFWFNYYDSGEVELYKYTESLKSCLVKVMNEVYIHSCILNQYDLEEVFKSSYNAHSLWLDWCQIGELTSDFNIDPSLPYKISEIYLVSTAVKDDPDWIDSIKFKILINAIKTVPSLLSNLKVIKLNDSQFPISDFDILNTSKDSNTSQTDTIDESQSILADFEQLKIENSEFIEPQAYM